MRVSIKSALTGLLSVLALVIGLQGGLMLLKLGTIRRNAQEMAAALLPSIGVISELGAAVEKSRVRQYRLAAATQGAQQLVEHRRMYLSVIDRVAAIRTRYEPLISSPEERALYERFSQAWAQYDAIGRRALALVEADRSQDALAEIVSPEMLKLSTTLGETIGQAIALNQRNAQHQADATVDVAATAALATWVALATALAGDGRDPVRPAPDLPSDHPHDGRDGLSRRRNVAVTVPGAGRGDEIGAMAGAVQVFKDNLVRTRRWRTRRRWPVPPRRSSAGPGCARWRMPSSRRSAGSSGSCPPRPPSCRRPPGR